MLSRIYPDAYSGSSAQANVASITFAGTVLGMLFFGYTSDHFSRKWSLFASTIIILLFAALGAGSYGAGGSPTGLLAALVAYRFFLGIGKILPLMSRKIVSFRASNRSPKDWESILIASFILEDFRLVSSFLSSMRAYEGFLFQYSNCPKVTATNM